MQETAKNIRKIIYFYAEWCSFCHTMQQVLSQHIDTVDTGVTLEKIDIDRNPEIMDVWGVRNIPMAIALDRDGRELSRHVGAADRTVVERWLKTAGLA
jgi:thioredoxin-like negative regulator of GroEL